MSESRIKSVIVHQEQADGKSTVVAMTRTEINNALQEDPTFFETHTCYYHGKDGLELLTPVFKVDFKRGV